MNCNALVRYDLPLTPCLCYVHRKNETGLYVEYNYIKLSSDQCIQNRQRKKKRKKRQGAIIWSRCVRHQYSKSGLDLNYGVNCVSD